MTNINSVRVVTLFPIVDQLLSLLGPLMCMGLWRYCCAVFHFWLRALGDPVRLCILGIGLFFSLCHMVIRWIVHVGGCDTPRMSTSRGSLGGVVVHHAGGVVVHGGWDTGLEHAAADRTQPVGTCPPARRPTTVVTTTPAPTPTTTTTPPTTTAAETLKQNCQLLSIDFTLRQSEWNFNWLNAKATELKIRRIVDWKIEHSWQLITVDHSWSHAAEFFFLPRDNNRVRLRRQIDEIVGAGFPSLRDSRADTTLSERRSEMWSPPVKGAFVIL